MKKTLTVLSVAVTSMAICVGIVYAATAHNVTKTLGGVSGDAFDLDGTLMVDSLKVGAQGTGGVTFFNGTIINNTIGTGGTDNPVAFGDNVRIDGRVYRGATAGTTDTLPFIVNDNMEVAGTLDVGAITADSLAVSGNLTLSSGNNATAKKVYTGTIDITQNGDEIATWDLEADCVGDPTYYSHYDYHYAKVAVPELSSDNIGEIRVYGKIKPSEGYGPNYFPDIANQWQSLSFSFIDGYVYILWKYIDYHCDGTADDPYYYTSGEYKIVIVY